MADNNEDNRTLTLECMDREETITTFNKFIEKSDKIIYQKFTLYVQSRDRTQ